jgi:hypothetical protein
VADFLSTLPADRRSAVDFALATAFGKQTQALKLGQMAGGASGALAYRVEANERFYVLRVEGRRTPLRNPHQYTCMLIASKAGIAPPVRYIDDVAGIVIMDFIVAQPLEAHKGGAVGLAQDAGSFIARLQATELFPAFIDYFDAIGRMFDYVRRSTLFAPGLLDPHAEALARIRAAWSASPSPVSSHNDPNLRNLLFDGTRLWLVDWETAYRNDPLVDVAIMLDQLASTPALEEALLRAWQGKSPDRRTRDRLTVMRPVVGLYYASLGFMMVSATPRERPLADLTAPTVEEFRAMITSGRLSPTSPDTLLLLGKMQLASFLAGVAKPGFEDALAAVRAG